MYIQCTEKNCCWKITNNAAQLKCMRYSIDSDFEGKTDTKSLTEIYLTHETITMKNGKYDWNIFDTLYNDNGKCYFCFL